MKNKKNLKLLIVSQDLPPSIGGSPILMDNIFSYFPGEMKGIGGYHGSQFEKGFKPSFPVIYINPPNIPIIGEFLRKYYYKLLKYFHWYIIKKINKEIKIFNPDAIYSNCPNIDFFICAYKASRASNTPLFVHMHDLWEENAKPNTYLSNMAKRYEEAILRHASLVFCMTEIQQLHYEEKYNIKTALIPHTIKDIDLDTNPNVAKTVNNNNVTFTGTISPVMNLDAMLQFAKMSHIINKNIQLNICTGISEEQVFKLGFNKNNTSVKWLTRNEVRNFQNESKVLFAPLSFKNGGMEEVKTVFSTKLLEYLISGRPIIIFAPAFSHHAISAKKNGWALVVDEDDPKKLATAIELLIKDEMYCKDIVKKAFIEAQSRKASHYANKMAEYILIYTNKSSIIHD